MTRKSKLRIVRDKQRAVPDAERVLDELALMRPDLSRLDLMAWVNSMVPSVRKELVARVVEAIGAKR